MYIVVIESDNFSVDIIQVGFANKYMVSDKFHDFEKKKCA